MKRLQTLLQLLGAAAMLAQHEALALAASALSMLLDGHFRIPRAGGVSARARLPLKVVGALEHLAAAPSISPEVGPIGD
ncbi:hypothetical protein [Dactylosporangium sp. NPDC051541]|uniref:hypothetical protein n=1 Tax=Dactylosporangium sp. NPDC051541 TaxID=3363977 RepID=UPI00378F4AA4